MENVMDSIKEIEQEKFLLQQEIEAAMNKFYQKTGRTVSHISINTERQMVYVSWALYR